MGSDYDGIELEPKAFCANTVPKGLCADDLDAAIEFFRRFTKGKAVVMREKATRVSANVAIAGREK